MKKKVAITLVGALFLVSTTAILLFVSNHNRINTNNDISPNIAYHQMTNASWIDHYSNIDSMIESSDIIISGKVVDSYTEQRVDLVFTKQMVEVFKTYKGELTSGNIEILQTGGSMNGIKTEPFEDAPLLDREGNYLLFLRFSTEGHYLVLGGFQGVGKIENDKVTFNINNTDIAQEFRNSTLTDIEHYLMK